MGAVGLVVRAELRHRWRSWVALIVLVAVVGGLVLGATAAGRRTATAFPRFVESYGYDGFAYSQSPLSGLPKLPFVTSSVEFLSPAYGAPRCACRFALTSSSFTLNEATPDVLRKYVKLVSGRWPNPEAPDEVLASFVLAHDEGIHVGSRIRVPFYAPSQAADALAGTGTPAGPAVNLRVVGIDASETDFPSVGTPSYTVIATPAFARSVNPHTLAFHEYAVKFRHGAADYPAFSAAITAMSHVGGTEDLSLLESTVANTIHPQAVGWWVLALLAGLAGIAMIGQALSRQSRVEAETNDTLAALGFDPSQLFMAGLARAALIGVAGGLGAVAVAYALSPLAPVGEARIADPSSGPAFDGLVLGLGTVALMVIVALLGLWPAWRDSRTRRGVRREVLRRPSIVVTQLASAGAPASTMIGVRRALERGSGRGTVPVGSALAGTAFAVAALCATAVFGSSLLNLTATPRLYGQAFGVWFRNFPDPGTANAVIARLQRDPNVTAITYGLQTPVKLNGISTPLLGARPVRGAVVIQTTDGRLPVRADEIAMGAKTMRQAGAHIGSVVRVSAPLPDGAARQTNFRVVGAATFPPDFGIVGFDTGAIATVDGVVAAECPAGPGYGACRSAVLGNPALMAGMRPGSAGRADAVRYANQFPGYASLPVKPTNLVNFGEAVNFPFILGVVLVLFGAATLVHVLVVSVARRRRELGLLKAIGFVRHQVAAAVCWQATAVAIVGIVAGVPFGIIGGRLIWHAFAGNLGVVSVVVIPVGTLVLLGVGVVVVANVLAAGPAFVSARSRAGVLLRAE